MKKRVIFAMSGGVDSSVGAYLLKEEGYEVIGATMYFTDDMHNDAKKVAEQLGIPHIAVDVTERFKQNVIKPFVNEYVAGKTPNPCVLCNTAVKWAFLVDMLNEYGADFIATGHYAKIVTLNGRYAVKKTKNSAKDQTYALYRLTQKQLEKTILPLGSYSKDKVRNIAKSAGLCSHDKADSQEICFIADNNYKRYIEYFTGKAEAPGQFVLEDGTVVGEHCGISKYTVGQRKGLGISYSEPLFVLKIDARKNRITLGKNESLYGRELTVNAATYMGIDKQFGTVRCYGKIRYAHTAALCEIVRGEKIKCVFEEPQRAITPGQSAVFYNEEGIVLAGGIIE